MTIFFRKARRELAQGQEQVALLEQQLAHQREVLRESIEAELAAERDEIEHERTEVTRRAERVELLIRNRVEAYGHLAAAWAEWEFVQGERVAFDLLYKPHPGIKAAELVMLRSRKMAELRREMAIAVNVTRLYEYHYPWLADFLADEHEVEYVEVEDYEEGRDDPARRHIAQAEWETLTEVERHQLALDRWLRSRRADPWEAGADYERYIGYLREQTGCEVTYHGIEQGYEDLGRDVLAHRDGAVEVIQCKRWGRRMGVIREKYIHQLVGTVLSMRQDNPGMTITGTFTTATTLSDVARSEADKLGITVEAAVPMGDYPRIKCNVGVGGERIYHLPFDQQYNATLIHPKKGECYAITCAEAEAKGFRRAWRWRGEASEF